MHDDINSGGGYFMHHVIPFTVVSKTDQNRQVGRPIQGLFDDFLENAGENNDRRFGPK